MRQIFCLMAFAIMSAACAMAQQSTSQPPQTQPQLGREPAASVQQPFSVDVVERLMSELRDGLIGQNRRRTLQVFAPEQMSGYQQFADALAGLFESHDGFRVRYHIVQVVPGAEGQRGAAMVDFTLEATPLHEEPPVRHHAQLKFEFAYSGKQWKIVNFEPRSFLSF